MERRRIAAASKCTDVGIQIQIVQSYHRTSDEKAKEQEALVDQHCNSRKTTAHTSSYRSSSEPDIPSPFPGLSDPRLLTLLSKDGTPSVPIIWRGR